MRLDQCRISQCNRVFDAVRAGSIDLVDAGAFPQDGNDEFLDLMGGHARHRSLLLGPVLRLGAGDIVAIARYPS